MLAYGKDAVVLEPPELVENVKAQAAELVRLYGGLEKRNQEAETEEAPAVRHFRDA